jgi:hypothetical protein
MADPASMVYTIDLYHLRAQPCKAVQVVEARSSRLPIAGTAGFEGADPGIGTLDLDVFRSAAGEDRRRVLGRTDVAD